MSDDVDLWAAVVGQDGIVEQLKASAKDPTHAYLFTGPEGVGTRLAAKAFAAEVLSQGAPPEEAARHRRLVDGGHHPAVMWFRRKGASLSADETKDLVKRAYTSPPEGSLQVLVVTEFHLVTGEVAGRLLKVIEEPPAGTMFVVLAEEVTPELVTIASRCMEFDFPHLSAAAISAQLAAEGVSPDVAEAAALSAGGDLDRARLLATDERVVDRRNFWLELPGRLDGTGARAAEMAGQVMARVAELLAPLEAQQQAEVDALLAQAERLGQRKPGLGDIDKRHKRESRRIRSDEMGAGLAALMERYRRDAAGDAAAFVEAGRLVGELAENLVFNVNEELALQALFVALPTRN